MPSFNIESILSELDSLPSMPNAVNVQLPQQQNDKLKCGESVNTNNTKRGSISSNRMIIFDWDDTLFPTTHFVTNATPITIKDLHEWGHRAHKLLKLYISLFGGKNIYIITNGIQGWIEYSLYVTSQKFEALHKDKKMNQANYFEEIFKLITIHGVKTISSQFSYSNFYPNDTKKWKECTFIDWAMHHFNVENNDNAQGIILSIGDSYDEWYAAKDCVQFLENASKTNKFNLQRIKLSNKPTLNYLMQEWDTLIAVAHHLKETKTSFDESSIYSLSLLLEQDQEDIDNDKQMSMHSIPESEEI